MYGLTTVVSRIMMSDNIEMLLITISDQYPNYYKALEICTEYFDSLDIMILFFLS